MLARGSAYSKEMRNKQHVLVFLEEKVGFEGGCGFRLEKWTGTRSVRAICFIKELRLIL